jgi:hypothetical protein
MSPPDPAMQLPNFVIAGVSKAGTTSLSRYLAQHPDVCASDVKEVRYFHAVRYGEQPEPVSSYAQHFRGCRDQRYRMEATPGYYAGGRRVAEAMDSLLPDVRVLVSFRDPVQRCWSWYRFVRSTARIPKEMSFARYLDRCEELHRDGVDDRRDHQPFWGLGGGCYDTWFTPWREVLGERFRVEFFERLVQEPRAVVESVCGWLGIDQAPCADFRYTVENATVQYKNRRLQRAALAVNRRSERFFTEHHNLKRALRGVYYRVNSDRSEERLDPALRDRLEAFYAPHNRRLAALLDAAGIVDCPEWVTAHAAPGVSS